MLQSKRTETKTQLEKAHRREKVFIKSIALKFALEAIHYTEAQTHKLFYQKELASNKDGEKIYILKIHTDRYSANTLFAEMKRCTSCLLYLNIDFSLSYSASYRRSQMN